MSISKLYTKRKTRNYVSYLIFFVIFLINSCEKIDDSEKDVIGSWYCSENSQVFGQTKYDVHITRSSSDTTLIYIDPFYQEGQVHASVNGRSITIPSQKMNDFTLSGWGSISSDYKTINWNYTVVGTETDRATAIYTR